jgi:branched-chain amino acid transport system ATP-binding protein
VIRQIRARFGPSVEREVEADFHLDLSGVVAGYGSTRIVHDISFSVPPNAVTLLIGRNGSGKSTLLKSIFGLADVFSGAVRLGGEDLTTLSIANRIARGVRYVPQSGGVFGSLRVEENLQLAGPMADRARRESSMAEIFDLFPTLKPIRRSRAGELSGGQQRLLAFAMGTMTKPAFLLVDEPSAGLSPLLARQVIRHLGEIRDQRETGILLVEQNVKEGCRVADHVYLLRDGQLHWQGAPDELLSQPSLAAFL